MKSKPGNTRRRNSGILATTALALAIPGVLYGTFYQGSGIDIGPDSLAPDKNIYALEKSGVIGRSNRASYWSLAVGAYNNVHNNAAAVGSSNTAMDLSFAVGYLNEVNAAGSGSPRSSMAVGTANLINGNNTFASGDDNTVVGSNSAAIGRNLSVWSNETVAVGGYNTIKPDLRFVVGNGTGTAANERSNALEVYANGDIVMKKQGDISMGEFDDIP